MSVISVSLPTDGTVADVSDYNNPINTIVNEFNGNIDNANIASGAAIDGTKIANGAISPNKLATGAQTLTVTTSEATSSAYPTDLTTTMAVTATIGSNGLAMVFISSVMTNNNASGQSAQMGFAVSGASTIAANSVDSLQYFPNTASRPDQRCGAFLLSGLTAGSTTFTAKFGQGGGGTATFSNRKISVIPL